MKNLITYLKTLWSWVADSQSTDVSVDRRLTVGSPSAFHRSVVLKLCTVLVVLLTIGVGNAWGADPVATETVATGKSFVVACWTGSKYVALPHFTTGSTPAGTDITVNASGKVTTADAPEWTFTKNPSNANQFYLTYTSSGTTYYLYKNGTKNSNYNIAGKSNGDKNYWTFTKSGSAYNVIAVDRGSNNTRLTYYVSGSKWEVYGTAATADIILLEKASACTSWSDPTVTYSATTLTAGGAHATVSVSGTTYGTRTFSSSDDDILTVNSTTGEVTPVSNGNASVTVSWAGNATYCSKDVVIDFTVNKAAATIKLSEAGAESTVSGTHYSGDSYTLPTTTSAVCGTKVLVGWSTETVAETDTKPTSNFYEKGASVTLEASQTFYAVFATASAGGGSSIDTYIMDDNGSLNSNWSDDQNRNGGIQSYAGENSFQMYGETATMYACELTSQNKFTDISGISINVAANKANTVYLYYSSNGSDWSTWDNTISVAKNTSSYTDYEFDLDDFPTGSYYICISNSTTSMYMYSVSITTGAGTTYSAYSTSCEACTANPTVGTAQLNGAFSLSSVGVTATGWEPGANCSWEDYGFVWGTGANPSLNNSTGNANSGCTKVQVGTSGSATTWDGTLTGSFTVGTTYYFRAYGKNGKDGATYQYSDDATFTPRQVSFNMHGHGGDAPANQVVNNGGKATDPGDPSEAGWTFGGWYNNDSYTGSAWVFGTNTVSGGNVTLHAKWTEKPKYTITLNAGNGSIGTVGWTNTSGNIYTKTQDNGDASITFPSASSNCAGWEFVGWATSAANNVSSDPTSKAAGATLVPASNVTYYAVYRQNATGGTTYNKITSTGDLTTGDYIIISSSSYAMKNVVNSGGTYMNESSYDTFSASGSSIETSASEYIWTIVKFGSQVVIKNGTDFLGINDDNNICLSTTPHFFTYTYNTTNSRWEFTSATKTTYQLVYNSYFKMLTSQSTAIYLYKQGAGLTGNYYTNPTCSDLSITGVADPAAGGSVTLSATSAKSGEKVYAYYTEDPAYRFNSWSVSGTGASISSTTAKFTEITVGSADVTLTANFDARVMYSVTWKANGEELTGVDLGSASTSVETGEKITNLPPNPSSCDGTSTTFMGWVEESEIWSGKTDDVSEVTIYSKVSDFPAVTGNVTYHAVWAKRNGSAAPATYAGTGTFTRITTLEELEVNAHYVLYGEKVADSSVKGAMNNTFSNPATGKYIFGGSSVSISEGKITNPAATIVWKLGGEENAYTLYSQNSSKYIEITANDTRAYSNPSEPTTSFTIAVSDGNFKIKSNHKSASNRMICLYTSTEFRSYSPDNTDYVLYLYKYGNDYTYNKYLVKCCEDPELAFDGEYNYQTLVRQDIHGARGGNGSATAEQGKATLVLDYSTESGGTCTVEVKKLTGGDNRSTAVAGSSCANHTGIAINESTKKVTFDVWTYAGSYPTANGQGTYRIKITQEATSTYCAAETYYFVDVILRDKFVDAVNGNTTINVDGQSKSTTDFYKTPTEASLDGDKNDDCHETTRRFLGWVREDNMDTWYGSSSDRTRDLDDKKDDAALVAPNADIITSGSTWYAIWGIEE